MTLYDACDIGYSMGLETIDECITNILIHSMNIFPYDDITDELMELHQEVEEKGFKGHESVEMVLGKQKMEEIDKTLEDLIFGQRWL